jgi:predicted Na+-dependent transporter
MRRLQSAFLLSAAVVATLAARFSPYPSECGLWNHANVHLAFAALGVLLAIGAVGKAIHEVYRGNRWSLIVLTLSLLAMPSAGLALVFVGFVGPPGCGGPSS